MLVVRWKVVNVGVGGVRLQAIAATTTSVYDIIRGAVRERCVQCWAASTKDEHSTSSTPGACTHRTDPCLPFTHALPSHVIHCCCAVCCVFARSWLVALAPGQTVWQTSTMVLIQVSCNHSNLPMCISATNLPPTSCCTAAISTVHQPHLHSLLRLPPPHNKTTCNDVMAV